MSTKIRPELSKKSEYYIPKYRYYELKYRCLQFHDWVARLNELDISLSAVRTDLEKVDRTNDIYDSVGKMATDRAALSKKIRPVEKAISHIDPCLRNAIFDAVTTGKGWTVIQAKYGLYCTRDEYYNAYHKFYYILDSMV